jgi:hypothetical protein
MDAIREIEGFIPECIMVKLTAIMKRIREVFRK